MSDKTELGHIPDQTPSHEPKVDLREVMGEAPESPIIKPARIGKGDIDNARVTEYLDDLESWYRKGEISEDDPLMRGWKNCQEAGYIEIDPQGKVFFLPVDPRLVAKKGKSFSFLLHHGELQGKGNNRANLQQNGVFGNPDQRCPTYLMLHDSGMTTFPRKDEGEQVDIQINIGKLLERRSIFIDPESMSLCGVTPPHYTRDKFGDSYIILGGIPKESIDQITIPTTQEVLRFN